MYLQKVKHIECSGRGDRLGYTCYLNYPIHELPKKYPNLRSLTTHQLRCDCAAMGDAPEFRVENGAVYMPSFTRRYVLPSGRKERWTAKECVKRPTPDENRGARGGSYDHAGESSAGPYEGNAAEMAILHTRAQRHLGSGGTSQVDCYDEEADGNETDSDEPFIGMPRVYQMGIWVGGVLMRGGIPPCTLHCRTTEGRAAALNFFVSELHLPGEGASLVARMHFTAKAVRSVEHLSCELWTDNLIDDISTLNQFEGEGVYKAILDRVKPSRLTRLRSATLSFITLDDIVPFRHCCVLKRIELAFPSYTTAVPGNTPMNVVGHLAEDGFLPALEEVCLSLCFTPTEVPLAEREAFRALLAQSIPNLKTISLCLRIPLRRQKVHDKALVDYLLAGFGDIYELLVEVDCHYGAEGFTSGYSPSQSAAVVKREKKIGRMVKKRQMEMRRKRIRDFERAVPGWRILKVS